MDFHDKGFQARKNGLPRSANPASLSSDEGIAWDTGWTAADADEQAEHMARQAQFRQQRGQEVYGSTAKQGSWGRMHQQAD